MLGQHEQKSILTKKIVFIIPYFWKLPNYFDLYLLSIKNNPQYDMLLITDDRTDFQYPSNVKVVYMTFDEVRKKIQQKFDFTISLDFPYKLCEYKPALWYIFEDMITGYDFWWHCDLDVILWDLSQFITDDMLNNYDKLFDLWHLTLYRNTYEINRAFMLPLDWKYRYKEVFQSKRFRRFDERNDRSINNIFDAHQLKRFSISFCADIFRSRLNFYLICYDDKERSHFLDLDAKQVFYWEKGKIFRIYEKKWTIVKEEFAYIHLQKRRMLNTVNTASKVERFGIVPNEFVAIENNLDDRQILTQYFRKKHFNTQFFVLWYGIIKGGYKHYGAIWLIKRGLFFLFR